LTSAYWTEVGPDGYDVKVRNCKNGCGIVVYWDDQVGDNGRFVELSNNEIHDCPNYKRNNTPQQKSSTQRPQQQQQDQSSHIQKIEEYSLIQVEELKRHTDLLVAQKENTDLMSQYLRAFATILKNMENKLDSKLKESKSEGLVKLGSKSTKEVEEASQ